MQYAHSLGACRSFGWARNERDAFIFRRRHQRQCCSFVSFKPDGLNLMLLCVVCKSMIACMNYHQAFIHIEWLSWLFTAYGTPLQQDMLDIFYWPSRIHIPGAAGLLMSAITGRLQEMQLNLFKGLRMPAASSGDRPYCRESVVRLNALLDSSVRFKKLSGVWLYWIE